MWQLTNGRDDVVQGLCLLFVDLQNVTYKDTCKIEKRYENEIYVVIPSLNLKPSEQNKNLIQKCTMIEGLFLVSANLILDSCFIIPDVGNTDEIIVLYINSKQTWVDKL